MANYQNNMCCGRQGNMRRQSVPAGYRQNTAAAVSRPAPSCEIPAAAVDKLSGLPLAMAYVPWQEWEDVYEIGYGFQKGTIFQQLDKPFLGKGGCCS